MRRLLFLACVWPSLVAGLFAQGDAELIEVENKVEAQTPPAGWKAAAKGLKLRVKDKVRTGEESRAAVRLGDLSVTRLDELTTFELGSPAAGKKPGFDLKQGGAYFFSREKSTEVEIRTPAVNGSLKGTALVVRVDGARTRMTVLEGEVLLSNRQGDLTLTSGESGEAWIGRKPKRTAVIEAHNIIQWALYYPGILTDEDLPLGGADSNAMAASVAAYRRGNLLKAVELYPRGHEPQSAKGRIFRAGLLLAVGQVDKARIALGPSLARHPGRNALEQVIAAVNLTERASTEPATASEWLAQSYYEQSRGRLEAARNAAREATRLAPDSGFAWVRLAELEFSFGRTDASLDALEKGRALTPENAQAAALEGWLRAAQNRIVSARETFEEAIHLDGALGAAWLGRGLTSIRVGQIEAGLRDLQVATVMEPNRAIYHSYLAKAFSDSHDAGKAKQDLDFSRRLDPGDPTPWIYSALENKAANRPNSAVRDLERALELTDNRRIYRSTFLLDQDRAVANANLASIYQGNGMIDVSVREAARAITNDQASAPAHLFLSNSYDALRDPRRIQLRYETAWFNELLLANLLAPVGGGSLSQYVSQQEYSKLFERDGFGFSTTSEALTDGSLRATASQFGTFGNLSYALDAQYYYDNGHRPNNRLSRIEEYAKVKLQLTPNDSIFLMAKFQDYESGDLLQRYDDGEVGREIRRPGMPPLKNTRALTTDFRERQEPGLMLAGWHHEWGPGQHTLLLLGRLANEQAVTAQGTSQLVLSRDIAGLFPASFPLSGRGIADDPALRAELARLRRRGEITAAQSLALDTDYLASFEIFSGELSHIATIGPQTLVVGGRWQSGEFDTRHVFDGLSPSLARTGLFLDPPSASRSVVDFDRVSIYAYDTLRVSRWLTLVGGVTYDRLDYPENFRSPPLTDGAAELEHWSPKVGFVLTPHRTLTLRGAYAEAISGASFDESVRLEPTQVAGFNQAYRTIISEDLIGSVAGSIYKTWSLSLDQKLSTGTYWGVELQRLEQDLDRTVGVFDFLFDGAGFAQGVLPSSTREAISYREDSLTATLNQLLGERWVLGARYRYTKSELETHFESIPSSLLAGRARESVLHEVALYAQYQHESGFFARGEALWFSQENDGFSPSRFSTRQRGDAEPGDSFWQLNAFVGWRLFRNQAEISLGVLNLLDTDYELEPLTPYREMPRERTGIVRVRLNL